jgi:hypothetical protein
MPAYVLKTVDVVMTKIDVPGGEPAVMAVTLTYTNQNSICALVRFDPAGTMYKALERCKLYCTALDTYCVIPSASSLSKLVLLSTR